MIRIAPLRFTVLLLALSSGSQLSRAHGEQAANSEAREHADRGMQLLQRGDLAAAEAELRRAVELAPRESTYLSSLGVVLGMEHKLDESSAFFQKALAIDSGDLATRRNLASNQFQLGQLQPAREHLQRVIKAKPDDTVAVLLLGMVDEELQDYGPAAKLLASVPERVRERPESMIALARAYYNTHRYAASETTLRNLIATGHETSDVDNLLGWCLYRQHHLKEAMAALDQAIQRDPSKESNYLDVAAILLENDRPTGALAAAERAVAVAPASYRAYRIKGLIETRLGRPVTAVQSCARAAELNPDDPQTVLALAQAELADGQTGEAEATFKQGIMRFPRDAALRVEYASMLLNMAGRTNPASESQAVSLLQVALDLDHSRADAHYELGNLAFRKGNLPEALDHLEKAAQLKPASPTVHYALARVYRGLGRTDEAAKERHLFLDLKDQAGKSASADAQSVTR